MHGVYYRFSFAVIPRRPILFLLSLAAFLSPAVAAILRVDPGASVEPADGLTWPTAFRSITNALSIAVLGDELWIKAGVYSGGITAKAGVSWYGGFGGTETLREERRPSIHRSIIDGRVTTNGIVFGASVQSNTRIDGFFIRNCVAGSGGAIRAISGSPVIANNWFSNCGASTYGGVIYLESSAAIITNNVFSYNSVDVLLAGGAILATNSAPRLVGNTFSGNRARIGGAVVFAQSSGLVEGNYFLANAAVRDGGGLVCLNSSPRITHNRFAGNQAGSRGGAVVISGGGSSPLVFNNVMVRNTAATAADADSRGGGGVFIDLLSLPAVVNNTLVSNTAPVGGIVSLNPLVSIANNVVAFGSSGLGGAATLQLFNNNVFGNGSLDYVDTQDPAGANGNLSSDPKFGGDLALGVVNVLPDSPNRDSGANALLPAGLLVDIDGKPRIQGSSVDIGAAETDGVSTNFYPPIIRVKPDGNDEVGGDSWANAMKTVQAAIDRASRTGGEVWVQAGLYREGITVRPYTYLYGGFAGTETNRYERNWLTNLTALDGGLEERVVLMTRLSLNETLDGFHIQNGRSTAGAGVFTDSSVQIRHNRFASNRTALLAVGSRGGGAVYVSGGSAHIVNNWFFRNSSTSSDQAVPAEGGAIKVNDGNPLIANNEFRQNSATNSAPPGEARGGAICMVVRGAPRIVNNTLLQNWTTVVNGAAIADRGAIYVGNTNTPALLGNNLIAYNTSGISAPGMAPELRNNLVFENIRNNYSQISNPTGTNGNLSLSPRLSGPYGDVHLAQGSPAVDAGDTNLVAADWTDLDGSPRLSGTSVDIGADEFDDTIYSIPDRIFFVSTEGDDSQDGRSWATARKSLAQVLLEAGLEGGEVWVKGGTYTNRVRADVFTYLYGGFNGTETNRTERNWMANPTILDGNISTNAGSVVFGAAVVSIYGLDHYAAVSGFTIQNGAGRQGGGVFSHGSPLISDNVIHDNVVSAATGFNASGAGIYSQGGSPEIRNNLIVGNFALSSAAPHGRGGAIYLAPPAGALPVLYNNTIINNFATNGGAAVFINTNGAARLINNLIAYNQSGVAASTPTQAELVELLHNLMFETGVPLLNVVLGAGNITNDPRLVDWRGGNYRLRSDSPCVDSGENSVPRSDFDWQYDPRLNGEGIDIGADEFTTPGEVDLAVVLTQPVQGAASVAPATILLSAEIAGATVPAYVEFRANNRLVAVSSNEPYSSFATGLLYNDYDIEARAVTFSGAVSTSSPVRIQVVLPPGNQSPTVRFSAPTNSQVFVAAGSTNIRANFIFAKPNGRILAWALYRGTEKVAENLAVPANQTNASVVVPGLSNGQHTLFATVMSSVGDRATNSVSFAVARPPVVPPVLTISHQPDGAIRLEMTTPTPGALYRIENSLSLTNWSVFASDLTGEVPFNTNLVTLDLEFFRAFGEYPRP